MGNWRRISWAPSVALYLYINYMHMIERESIVLGICWILPILVCKIWQWKVLLTHNISALCIYIEIEGNERKVQYWDEYEVCIDGFLGNYSIGCWCFISISIILYGHFIWPKCTILTAKGDLPRNAPVQINPLFLPFYIPRLVFLFNLCDNTKSCCCSNSRAT